MVCSLLASILGGATGWAYSMNHMAVAVAMGIFTILILNIFTTVAICYHFHRLSSYNHG